MIIVYDWKYVNTNYEDYHISLSNALKEINKRKGFIIQIIEHKPYSSTIVYSYLKEIKK